MKVLKNNFKIIIAFVLGAILTGGIVYAAVTASDVTYTTAKNEEVKNVEQALNDLYSKQSQQSQQSSQGTVSFLKGVSGTVKANTKATTVSVTGLTVGNSYLFVCFRPYTGGQNAYMRNDTACYQCTFSNVTSATLLEEAHNNFIVVPSSDTVTVTFPAFSVSKYSDYGACPYVLVYNI